MFTYKFILLETIIEVTWMLHVIEPFELLDVSE